VKEEAGGLLRKRGETSTVYTSMTHFECERGDLLQYSHVTFPLSMFTKRLMMASN